jgi:hypothetical protein
MEWWLAVLGFIMSLLATADLAYKYGFTLSKKSKSRIRRRGFLKKGGAATTFKKIVNSWSRPRSTKPELIQGSYARATKIRPSFDVDIAVYYPQLKKI